MEIFGLLYVLSMEQKFEYLDLRMRIETQRDIYSKKKKQFSVNVLIICLLNGRIIYVSKHRKGAHDQSHWNQRT
jgi:hypothetical protein